MTVLHMLDTDTSSYVIKGRSKMVRDKLAAVNPSLICISAITRAELLYGLKGTHGAHPARTGVPRFLQLVQVFAWSAECADWYAEIRHQLHVKGQLIGEMDVLIAAHAIAVGASLVTNNTRHFQRIGGPLKLANWTEQSSRKA